ncbi:MAG: hypothetical protein ACK41O_26785 [Runella zeae]
MLTNIWHFRWWQRRHSHQLQGRQSGVGQLPHDQRQMRAHGHDHHLHSLKENERFHGVL